MSHGVQKQRLANEIRSALVTIIRRDLKDPRIDAGLVSIANVELNRDSSVARIHVSFLGDDAKSRAELVAILRLYAPKFRGPLGRNLGRKRVPELRFHSDESADIGERIDSVLEDDFRKREEHKE